MSTTTIWKVYKTVTRVYRELHNAHGSAPPVWDWLCDNYLDGRKWLFDRGVELSQLYKNPDVPEHMRFALLTTFDNGVVQADDLETAAELASRVHNTTWKPQYVNHWKAISEAYRELSAIKDWRLVGVGLGCTSVCDPWSDIKERNPFSIISQLALPIIGVN